MKFILYLLLPLITLSGCAVFAVGAGVAAVGTGVAVATDPRNSGTVVDDNKIEAKLKLKYADYTNTNIYVNSYGGKLLLTGQVANKQTESDAIFEAKAMPGVKKIYDYMEIRLPQSFASITADTYTTTQVKSKIFAIPGVSSNSVKVITTNSTVYLLGILPKEQIAQVAKAASEINGVKKVVTIFEYITNQ